jgi:NADH-quinone oxidoreductase subunit A
MFWPIAIYFAAVLFITGSMLGISYLLGPRHCETATGEPYEGGIVSTGSARIRLSAKFYLVAMFFLIFDLESVFLYAWAVAGREAGWLAYWEALIFMGVLAATLAYLWRIGALDWAKLRRHTRY